MTKNTVENIIGDVEAVSNILTTISMSDKVENQKETRDRMIDEKVTESILRFEKGYEGLTQSPVPIVWIWEGLLVTL